MRPIGYSHLLLLICSTMLNSKVIMWDLGGTLFDIRRVHFGRKLGLLNTLLYKVKDKQNPRELMDTLYTILKQGGVQAEETINMAEDDKGNPFPLLMCEWLQGSKSPKRVYDEAVQYVWRADNTIFYNKRQKKLILHLVKALFNPREFALSVKPISKAISLFKRCAEWRDPISHQPHQLVIVSNWDPVSFKIIYKLKSRYKKIFRYINPAYIFISGNLRLLKPQKSFFEHVLKEGQFDPEECILIDDQEKNIQSAASCGITGIHLKDKDYKKLEQALESLKIL